MARNNRKLYVAALGVAGVGFLADYMFSDGGGLGPGAAAAALTGPATEAPAATAVPPVVEDPTGGVALADRLLEVEKRMAPLALEGLDAFGSFVPDPEETAPENEEQGTVESPRERADAFAGRHALHSVMRTPGGGLVVVDGRRLAVGEAIEGFTLTAVRGRSAVFEAGGVSVELTIASSGVAKAD